MRQPERAVALAGLLLRPMSSGSHLAPIGVGAAPDACSRRPCGRPKLQAHDVARRREWPSYLPGPEHDVLGSGWLSQHWLLGKMCWYIATRGNTDLVWWQTGHHEREWPGYLPGPEHDLLGRSAWCARLPPTGHHERLVCWRLALHRHPRHESPDTEDDIPDTMWACSSLSDKVLLQAPKDTNYPEI